MKQDLYDFVTAADAVSIGRRWRVGQQVLRYDWSGKTLAALNETEVEAVRQSMGIRRENERMTNSLFYGDPVRVPPL